eukprot:TRINITY_DN8687_c0_g1_i2.p1 TRINITY_DN8687_c0_g1~~TRINITY_DN8687_c0_g1_i2.p1  ORF type:complete len:476 (+),score=90.18 TRINITY_DN8687_c0_g1_i2:144-1571(+)
MASSAVKLADLNDFINPSQVCIKPVEIQVPEDDGSKPARIEIEPDGSYIQVTNDGKKTKLQKASITLNDCLACSGCITSAESILIEMQNHAELKKTLLEKQETGLVVAACIAQQSYSSLAAKHGISALDACGKIVTYLKKLGADYVFDASLGRSIALRQCTSEFRHRKLNGGVLPVLTSACPGWICYAEKSHGDVVLPYISTVKSPQQIMGSLIKRRICQHHSIEPSKIYVVSIMPCYDKKLEASRSDFYSDVYRTKDVDVVIATNELEVMLTEDSVDIQALSPTPLDSLVSLGETEAPLSHHGSGSGGYLHHVYSHTIEEPAEETSVPLKTKRDIDFQEAGVDASSLGKVNFALANGFKSIQNIVRRIKRRKCPYDYVEIMACPRGCNNGGGQLKDESASVAPGSDSDMLARTQAAYDTIQAISPEADQRVEAIYRHLKMPLPDPNTVTEAERQLFHTGYHAVESTLAPQLETW